MTDERGMLIPTNRNPRICLQQRYIALASATLP